MTTGAFWAYGSILQYGDGATPEVFTAISEITELVPPNMSRDSIDVSSNSSSDGYREYIAGWRDGGEVSVKSNWLPTNATHDGTTGVLASFNDNLNHNWRIVLPDSIATINLRGHVKDFNPDLPLEEQGILEFVIKISGKPTIA